MKYKTGLTLVLTITCLLLSTFPSFAGAWQKTEEDQWQYIQEDGTKVTGWLELDEHRYYLDSKGNRKCDYWLKDHGDWYYLNENGEMAANTWIDNYYVNETGKLDKIR